MTGPAESSWELGNRETGLTDGGAETTSLCVWSHSRDGSAVPLAPKQAGERKGENLQGRRESRQAEGPWREAQMTALSQVQEERGLPYPRRPQLPDHTFRGPRRCADTS